MVERRPLIDSSLESPSKRIKPQRQEQNRLNQKAFRQRREEKFKQLLQQEQEHVTVLEDLAKCRAELNLARSQNASLRNDLAHEKCDNAALREENAKLRSTQAPAVTAQAPNPSVAVVPKQQINVKGMYSIKPITVLGDQTHAPNNQPPKQCRSAHPSRGFAEAMSFLQMSHLPST
jgi:hypothetical protein